MPKLDRMHETEVALDAALCNFCNNARDPFPPASQWDEAVWRNLGQLSAAYNDWWKWKKDTAAAG